MRSTDGLMRLRPIFRFVPVFAIFLFVISLPAVVRSENSLTMRVVDHYGNVDTILPYSQARLQIAVANDVPLTGLGLGFSASSPDGADFATGSCEDPLTFPDCPFVSIVSGSRASQISWQIDCRSNSSADQFYIGLNASGDAMAAGEAEDMLSICFYAIGSNEPGDTRTLCFDSLLYPPDGEFVFIDAQQNSVVPEFNGPLCVPVLSTYECYAMITNDNPTEVTVDHSETAHVDIWVWTLDQGPAQLSIHSVTGGSGTATVTPFADDRGVVTYTPAPDDVGKTVTIEVEPACLDYDIPGTDIWTLLVHVTNQPLRADFGGDSYCAAIDNGFRKQDMDAYDPGGAALQYIMISGHGDVDPATGHYFWVPGVDDYGLHTVEMGVTDGYDTLTGSFTVDVRDVSCCPGDVNADCAVGIDDAVYYINYIFRSGLVPPVMNWADPNHDCSPGIDDVVYIINYIFKYGPEPEVGCLESTP